MREKPANYGAWWNLNDLSVEWYERNLFASRPALHADFMCWAAQLELGSVLEVGCGCSSIYSSFFAAQRYVGLDISAKEIEWCRMHDQHAAHAYLCGDVIELPVEEQFDLVFSHAVVDHVYDIERFLEALVKRTKQHLYVSAYRGWFPELEEHRYTWDDTTTCFYNDLAPLRVKQTLARLGCTEVEVTPLPTGKTPIQNETRIVASGPVCPKL